MKSEDRIIIGTTDDVLAGVNPVSIFCNGRGAIDKTLIEFDDAIHELIVKGTAGKQVLLSVSSNPIVINGGANSSSIGNIKDDFMYRLVRNGYSKEKADELVTDIIAFTEKHSISCLEDSFHYFMESIKKIILEKIGKEE